MGGHPRAGDDHFDAALLRGRRILMNAVGTSVRTHRFDLEPDPEPLEDRSGLHHLVVVRCAAVDDADPCAHAFSSICDARSAISVRNCFPLKSIASTASYARARACARSAPSALTASTRPPAVTILRRFFVPAWNTNTSCIDATSSRP